MSNNYYNNNQWNSENLPAPQANVVPTEEIVAPEAEPTPPAEEATGTVVQ